MSNLHQPGHVSWSAVIQAMLGLERAYLLHHSRSEQSFLEGVGLSHSGWQLPRVLFHCSRILRRLNSRQGCCWSVGLDGPGPRILSLLPEGKPLHTLAEVTDHPSVGGQGCPYWLGLIPLGTPNWFVCFFFVRNELGRRQWVNRALPLPAFLTSSACTA